MKKVMLYLAMALALAWMAPLIARAHLFWSAQLHWVAADEQLLKSALVVGLPLFALVLSIPGRAGLYVTCFISLLWSLIQYANLEVYEVLGGILDLGYARLMLDKTFVLGSAVRLSHPLVLSATILVPLLFIWRTRHQRPREGQLPLVLATLCLSFLMLSKHKETMYLPAWRQVEPLHFNLHELWEIASKPRLSVAAVTGKNTAAVSLSDSHKEEVEKLFTADLTGTPYLPTTRARNILLIVVESMSEAYFSAHKPAELFIAPRHMKKVEDFLSSTPHLRFLNFLAHNRQTHRGQYSLLCGDYPNFYLTTDKFAKVIDAAAAPKCLPRALTDRGWQTFFMQASMLAFVRTGEFMKKAGFETVLGDEAFSHSQAQRNWGVDDGTLYDAALQHVAELNTNGKPWFAVVQTISTHHPFAVPENFEAPGKDPAERAFAYADQELARFLQELKNRHVFDDTLVLITGDESAGGSKDPTNDLLIQSWLPLMIITPDREQHLIEETFSQTDIALSLLDYTDTADHKHPFIGRSIFRSYSAPRLVPFANTYLKRLGMFYPPDGVVFCNEDLEHCQHRRHGDKNWLSTRPEETSAENLALRLNQLRYFNQRNEWYPASIQDSVVLDHGSYEVRSREPVMIMGGQEFTLPAGKKGCMSVHMRVVSGEGSLSADILTGTTKEPAVRRDNIALTTAQKVTLSLCHNSGDSELLFEPRVLARSSNDTPLQLEAESALFSITTSL